MTGENLRLGLHDRRRHEGVQERGHRQLISRPPRVGACTVFSDLVSNRFCHFKSKRSAKKSCSSDSILPGFQAVISPPGLWTPSRTTGCGRTHAFAEACVRPQPVVWKGDCISDHNKCAAWLSSQNKPASPNFKGILKTLNR